MQKVAIPKIGTYKDINNKKYKFTDVIYVKTSTFDGYILKKTYDKQTEWIELTRISNIIW